MAAQPQRILRIPRPSSKQLGRYWKNWWWSCGGLRKPYNSRWSGTCFDCDRVGTLGSELIYRGDARPRNLLCDTCASQRINKRRKA